MPLLVAGAFGAGLFATAGWLGRRLADTRYAMLERAVDGPLPVTIPGWAFLAVPAGVGVAAGLRGVQPVEVALLLLAVSALAVCAATDTRTGMIPDLFTLGPLIVVLAVCVLRHDWLPPAGAVFAFVPFAAVAAVSRGRGMGWGDVKLAALGGALVGIGGITLAVALASLWAYIAGRPEDRARRPIAFGPYLAASIAALLGLGSLV